MQTFPCDFYLLKSIKWEHQTKPARIDARVKYELRSQAHSHPHQQLLGIHRNGAPIPARTAPVTKKGSPKAESVEGQPAFSLPFWLFQHLRASSSSLFTPTVARTPRTLCSPRHQQSQRPLHSQGLHTAPHTVPTPKLWDPFYSDLLSPQI